LEATAIKGAFLALGDDLEQQLGATRVQVEIPEFVEQQQVQATIAADGSGQGALVGGLDQLVDQRGGGDIADRAALLAGRHADADQQVGLAGAGRNGDRLQHLRLVLPAEVRVTAEVHPLFGRLLFGRLLWASGFRRLGGVLHLVVTLLTAAPGRSAPMPPACSVTTPGSRRTASRAARC
jgi:hypothetical protein